MSAHLKCSLYTHALPKGQPIAINPFIQRTLNVGIGAVGLILVAYGCLGLLHSGSLFLALSMVLR